ncbi:DNA polymerase III subunit gamma/tau [Candidatus Kinetoplastidibacterium crithidiae]|uniref:DNA polymerase III subunit gamma/tau n=1 Tax=Candidatus Kinetoplastidibacterium crithidiae TCC036E TaxID=1208918 RepID=M1LP21_9PROT|nr:DNA polymerase III subunit gamma/tau [Candidatus Kinetoplastibacterium crithidii]AFZ83157.1 DNA polymerase III subunits gamma and tau [Candidatus Kinetoplastibacterium crithidii (ex Angomonas deanei ATCC 30255)]AGF47432.1 DNA polymerase III subunit gamma/tau [Candidatus Kinetoplastibacterium crithidii TCC036E]
MSYLVLARKWRPKSFDEVVGQDHVVKALVNSLNSQRLHHAWLFSGIRGVGKTSLARILAKSLNCERGITSKPCGTCSSCRGIDSGGSLDYLELDAASNRGVEEMSNLLSQANYTPVIGRFKVFLVDEVHMLTNHAFNSILKTLEEPPDHVKFIFATTDLHKIPITVLSRCLCFNLRKMSDNYLIKQLSVILSNERISFDESSLVMIARLAKGSMRDALSLTDQAISYGDGVISIVALREMFGMVDSAKVIHLLQSILLNDVKSLIDIADNVIDSGFSYETFLSDLAILLSRVAIIQHFSDSEINDIDLISFKDNISPDLTQLLYAVVTHSSQELAQSPDQYSGFLMICFRLLSLASQFSNNNFINESLPKLNNSEIYNSTKQELSISSNKNIFVNEQKNDLVLLKKAAEINIVEDKDSKKLDKKNIDFDLVSFSNNDWLELVPKLSLHGFVLELARQSEFVKVFENNFTIRVSIPTLASHENKLRLQTVLSEYFDMTIKLDILVGATGDKTAHARSQAQQLYKKKQLEQIVDDDPFVKEVVATLDGDVLIDSISELD